jgi:hypothetical protein
MMAESSGAPLLECIEIDHDDLDAPFRIAANNEDISHDGDLYTACMFEVTHPRDGESSMGVGRLALPNPDQWLTASVRSLSGPFRATFRTVRATDLAADPPEFDGLEIETMPLVLSEVSIDESAIYCTLQASDLLDRAFPVGVYDLASFGSLRR